jgi:3'-5' exoribonuclease 1
MTVADGQCTLTGLAALSLDTRGHKDVLQKRLARANKARATVAVPSSSTEKQVETLNELQANRPEGELYDSFLCFDVEATCERMDNVYGRAAFS